jgi:hypothetical protein
MTTTKVPKHAAFVPFVTGFLDHVLADKQLKNDRELGEKLGVSACVVSSIRAGRVAFGPTYIIRAHEAFEYEVKFIKNFITGQ